MRFQVAPEFPGGSVRLAATFVNYVWTIKITQKRGRLGVPFIIFRVRRSNQPTVAGVVVRNEKFGRP